MRRRLVLLGAALAVLVLTPASASPSSDAIVLTVEARRVIGTVNRDLVGFGWNDGGAPLFSIAALEPHLVRIDASLQDVSTSATAPLRLDQLLQRVAAVRGIGGEPLVILSYLPAWLGAPAAFGRDPTRVAPADLDAWERLVHDVVHALATAPSPALRFEAWNEPDSPLFWQDTPMAWVDTVERSARAVAAVERETGLDLQFGGPATAVPDPVYLLPFVGRLSERALPLDFVSWHYYANFPFFGPDGVEFEPLAAVQPVLGQRNPLASPSVYGPQVDLMRELTAAALAGSGRPIPALVLDEWNLSAAGFDRRHDAAEGAAFAAATLIELQEHGLDESAFFRANDTRGVPGEHGLVTTSGHRKPAWFAFALWQQLAARQVALAGASDPLDDVWAVASVDPRRLTILLARFRATETPVRTVDLRIRGLPLERLTATVRRIDASHLEAVAEVAKLSATGISLDLPSPGVVLVELR